MTNKKSILEPSTLVALQIGNVVDVDRGVLVDGQTFYPVPPFVVHDDCPPDGRPGFWRLAGDTFIAPPMEPDVLATAKAARNAEINRWRDEANFSAFEYAGKRIAVDKDIMGAAAYVALFGAFPPDFKGFWKTEDNTYIEIPDIDTFKAMFQEMVKRGSENFNRSEDLKAALAEATTAEDIAAIVW